VLSLKSVRHLYGAREALRLERFEAAAGEHWLVLGPSGCGKTTLLHIVSGLLRPSEGEVRVGDQPLAALSGSALDRWRGRTLGIVPQKLHLVPSLSVLQNLLLAQFLAGMPEDSTRARAVLDQVRLGERSGARPAQLSHGEAQRAAVKCEAATAIGCAGQKIAPPDRDDPRSQQHHRCAAQRRGDRGCGVRHGQERSDEKNLQKQSIHAEPSQHERTAVAV